MKKYEYLVRKPYDIYCQIFWEKKLVNGRMNDVFIDLNTYLNHMGHKGWELIAINGMQSGTELIFKREIQE